MSLADGAASPLHLTRSPRLDNALRLGWDAFSRTLAASGGEDAARWIAARTGDPELVDIAEPLLAAAIDPDPDPEESAEALFALAELAEETDDDLLADTFWEGALDRAQTAGDGDLIAEATRRLAALAERLGDPLAAAEFFIGFLNWRRQPAHSSDPDDVEDAFDAIVRLATIDGAHQAAAEYGYRQVQFTRLLDAEDERAVEGNWEAYARPYEPWA
ncbi:MAG: hypothetical protein H0T18_09055 [Chloroflexia bacterium]|nr:hypothetical protein [Chloroflexia bacterium]